MTLPALIPVQATQPTQQVPDECEVRLYSGGEHIVCGRGPVVVAAVGVCEAGREFVRGVCDRCLQLAAHYPLMPCSCHGLPVLVTFVPVTH